MKLESLTVEQHCENPTLGVVFLHVWRGRTQIIPFKKLCLIFNTNVHEKSYFALVPYIPFVLLQQRILSGLQG
jgi:hypothetical protein